VCVSSSTIVRSLRLLCATAQCGAAVVVWITERRSTRYYHTRALCSPRVVQASATERVCSLD
jgi:hypothetical protein